MNAQRLSFQTPDRIAEHTRAAAQYRPSPKPSGAGTFVQEDSPAGNHDFGKTLRDRLAAASRGTNESKASQDKETLPKPSASSAVNQPGKDSKLTSQDTIASAVAGQPTAGQLKQRGSASFLNNPASPNKQQHKAAQPDKAATAGDDPSDEVQLFSHGQPAFASASLTGNSQVAAIFGQDDEAAPVANPIDESSQIDGTNPPLPAVGAPGELAIAMRISTAGGPSTVSGPGLAQSTGSLSSLGDSRAQSSSPALSTDSQPRRVSEAAQLTGFAAGGEEGALNTELHKSGAAEATQPVHPADLGTELQKYRNEPIRAAHVQIAGADNQRVNIQLVERGGTLSVLVKSDDHALTKAIQDHVPELNTRLASNHFRPSSGRQAQRTALPTGNLVAGIRSPREAASLVGALPTNDRAVNRSSSPIGSKLSKKPQPHLRKGLITHGINRHHPSHKLPGNRNGREQHGLRDFVANGFRRG